MSGSLLRLAGTAAVTTWTLLATAPAVAVPDPAPSTTAPPAPSPSSTAPATLGQSTTPQPDPAPSTTPQPDPAPGTVQPQPRPLAQTLTDFQQLYRAAESATETYNATTEQLKQRQAEADRLDGQLARVRLELLISRAEAGRLARQQYQGSTSLSPYVRLLFARDPQRALDMGHLIGQLTRERAAAVNQLAGAERSADALARAARKALDDQLTLTDRRKRARDDAGQRLKDIGKLLASLTPEQLTALARYEQEAASAGRQSPIAASPAGGAERPRASGQEPATDAR